MRHITLTLTLFLGAFLHLQAQITAHCNGSEPKVLLVGDSWAQYMGDDNVHNHIFNEYGHSDKELETKTFSSLFDIPVGTAYAISGSEAREWANTGTYPYMTNMLNALNENPEVELVILSIGGNDVLAGKPDGGWYKDMDLDVAGSEAALFSTIESNTLAIINAALDVRPTIKILLSSYEYPNFEITGFDSWLYSAAKRRDLSRDPNNDLITSAELNGMMLTTEAQRQSMVDGLDRVFYDNSIGLMHYVYGSSAAVPGALLKPEATSPYMPGGDASLPTLRENFRLTVDPIHLDADAYVYKVKNQMDNYIFDSFRGEPDATFYSEGGSRDGWVNVNGSNFGTNGIRMGDNGSSRDWRGILSFDTGNLPDNASVTGASIYLHRSGEGGGDNPYSMNDRSPHVDIKNGSFGNAGVELNDGTSAADATDVGCFHGDVDEDYYVTRIDIHPSYLQHFNTTGQTQFRIYFDKADASANFVGYFDGSQNGFTSNEESRSSQEEETIVYEEKMISRIEEDGTVVEEFVVVAALAHRGLSELMGTTAPFLDVSYELVLPAELLSFDVKPIEKEAHLKWESTSEKNFLGYTVERSKNGREWSNMAFVEGKGSDEQSHQYSWIDHLPFSGQNYYRLAMEDVDGTIEYSPIRAIVFEGQKEQLTVYPNPFKNEIHLQFNNSIETAIDIELVDMLGRTIQHWTNNDIGLYELDLHLDSGIPAGTYWLKAYLQGEIIVAKVSKM